MCGINGFIEWNSCNEDRNRHIIQLMNDKLKHRGPDDEGVYANAIMAIGMRRLSVIDLSSGHQPIWNEDKTLAIIFNGEIYNFRMLRKSLLELGHQFQTESDTEVILHAFEEYGTECPKYLEGMFAFAIYNCVQQTIFLARDRAGEKPLYYGYMDGKFFFSSELKALSVCHLGKLEINNSALAEYLQLTYIPAPNTIFKNISKLEAGTWMSVSQTKIEKKLYWQPKIQHDQMIYDFDSAVKQLRITLTDEVEKCMVSDVPIGAFLSGGIDSSIIVGLMSKIAKRPIETFSMGFKQKEFDETKKARLVSERFGTHHNEQILDYSDALEFLDVLLENMDEPFADSSAIPTFAVSRFARQHVTVALTGDAGDELFGGYSKYLIGHYSDQYNRIPAIFRSLFYKSIHRLPDKSVLMRKLRKVVDNSQLDVYQQRLNLMRLGLKPNQMVQLMLNVSEEDLLLPFARHWYDENPDADEIARALFMDYKVVLEGDMLVKVDRMSMLNSLETRVPFLGKDITELAFKIPSSFKIQKGQLKIILKEAFFDMLPPSIIKQTKTGFGVPISDWFRGPLKGDLLKAISQAELESAGLLCPQAIQNLCQEHFDYKTNNGSILWSIFVFQRWFEKNKCMLM